MKRRTFKGMAAGGTPACSGSAPRYAAVRQCSRLELRIAQCWPPHGVRHLCRCSGTGCVNTPELRAEVQSSADARSPRISGPPKFICLGEPAPLLILCFLAPATSLSLWPLRWRLAYTDAHSIDRVVLAQCSAAGSERGQGFTTAGLLRTRTRRIRRAIGDFEIKRAPVHAEQGIQLQAGARLQDPRLCRASAGERVWLQASLCLCVPWFCRRLQARPESLSRTNDLCGTPCSSLSVG